MSLREYDVYHDAGYPHGISEAGEFAETFELVAPLVPYAYRCADGLDTFREFRQVREFFDALPKTAGSVAISTLHGDTELTPGTPRTFKYLDAVPTWRLSDRNHANRTRYGNPKYVHGHTLDHVTDTDARRELLEGAAQYGFVTARELEPAFGVTSMKDAVYKIDGFEWKAARRDGARRMCRTIILASAWLDRDIHALLADLGLPATTFYEWREQFAVDDLVDEIPPDPCGVYERFPM